VIPITSGGVVVNAGAAAAILLVLGASKDIAINFSLAAALLLTISALVATLAGIAGSLLIRALTRGRARRSPHGRPTTDKEAQHARVRPTLLQHWRS
jgi:hypothetical protein